MSTECSPAGGQPAEPEARGFTFPGELEITAMGIAEAELERRVPAILSGLGLPVRHETVQSRASREGRFVSVTVSFQCPDRKAYQAAQAALRADPDIRYIL